MDPNIQNIILGVVANGITSLIAYLGQKGRDFIIGDEILKKINREKTALGPILQQATDALAEKIEWEGPARLEEICLFLSSPEVETIARQIYSTKLSKDKNELDLIKEEFLNSFSIFIGIDKDKLIAATDDLFKALIAGCESALTIAIDDGILSAHEAKSAFRHRRILDELSSINKNIEILTSREKLNIKVILEFEKKYRKQVANRHKFIVPPDFETARKLPIESLYVNPYFLTIPQKKDEEGVLLETADFLSSIYRAVILGNPGAGKSTFVQKLCYDLSNNYAERLFGGRQVTPILVVLRDYGAEKKAHHLSLLQFIELTANSKYQVSPPPEAFHYLLLNGRLIVIFDGLDELLDTSYRQEISGDIELFCSLCPSVPVIVTSRVVGYEQAPLDREKFESFLINDFDDEQVEEYVTKWFAAEIDLTEEQQKEKAKNFIEESEIVPDLRSNPLMLSLMCNIYRGENYIPQNRPDVYEKCTTMLFERWDKGRGIHVSLPFEAHIKPAMMYLAFWIYADESLQGGVTERELISKATDYLCERRFEDRDEAQRAASEFISFCRGRAWVFTDTGTTKTGEKLYQFTHRTFLEYFTAAHLVRIYPTPDRLGKIILPKIALREWDIVAQLAFQIQNKNVDGAGDQLLTKLIKEGKKRKGNKEWNLLSFAARCLEFLIPSPRVTRNITSSSIEIILNRMIVKDDHNYEEQRSVREYLRYLLNTAVENHTFIANVLENYLVSKINFGSEQEAVLAGEIAMHLTDFLYIKLQRSHLNDYWNQIIERIIDSCSERLFALAHNNSITCIDLFWKGRVTIHEFVTWHGIVAIFVRPHSKLSRYGRYSVAFSIVKFIINPPVSQKTRTIMEKTIKEVGIILLSCSPPWVEKKQTLRFVAPRLMQQSIGKPLTLDSDGLFGTFAILATMSEDKEERLLYLIKLLKNIFPSLSLIIGARYKAVDSEKVEAEMEKCGFTNEQKSIVWQWILNEIQFCRARNKKRPIQRRFDIEDAAD